MTRPALLSSLLYNPEKTADSGTTPENTELQGNKLLWHRSPAERCHSRIYMHTYVCTYTCCHCKDKTKDSHVPRSCGLRRKFHPFFHLSRQGLKGEGMLLEALDQGSCCPALFSLILIFSFSPCGRLCACSLLCFCCAPPKGPLLPSL